MRSLSLSPPRAGLAAVRGGAGRDDACASLPATNWSRAAAATAPIWCGCGRSARPPISARPTQDDHTRLVGGIFEHLTQGRRRLPEEWARGQFEALDRLDGDIDALSARLARVRTLAYVAQRGDWLDDAAGWAGAHARAGGPAQPTRCTSG